MRKWQRRCLLTLERKWSTNMSKTTVTVGVLVDDYSVSFIEVCEGYNISEQQLLEILEHGLISSIETPNRQLEFDREMFLRISRALRLQQDLGLNAAGVVLALELLDELENVNQELDILRKHLGPGV